MLKQLLLGAAVLGFASPSFAQTNVPAVTAYVSTINSNIACRNKVRAKYFELGATNMSNSNDNAQWANINGMKALTWCRDTQAIIVVSGSDNSSIGELRDEILKVF